MIYSEIKPVKSTGNKSKLSKIKFLAPSETKTYKIYFFES